MDINSYLDQIFLFVKSNCRLGNFDIVNEQLKNIGILNEDLLVGYLVATLDWKDKLKYRSILFEDIKYTLSINYSDEEVNEMLYGLE